MQKDFIESNDAKKVDNHEKKQTDYHSKFQETYKYFPYTGSDDVEKKRALLKEGQQKEFQSFLKVSGSNSSEYSQTGAQFNKSLISPLNDNLSATLSLRGSDGGRMKMVNFLEHMQPDKNQMIESKAPVKTLFDHGHNKRNKLVIYDDEPKIEAVMQQALDRHHAQVKDHENYVTKANTLQHEINMDKVRHSDLKKQSLKQQQDEMKAILGQQVNFRVRYTSFC